MASIAQGASSTLPLISCALPLVNAGISSHAQCTLTASDMVNPLLSKTISWQKVVKLPALLCELLVAHPSPPTLWNEGNYSLWCNPNKILDSVVVYIAWPCECFRTKNHGRSVNTSKQSRIMAAGVPNVRRNAIGMLSLRTSHPGHFTAFGNLR